ncbi:hypothetical protein [uncultured Aquimarina sp.]|uniref:hypothetical protein n=1 Tax=uncultured Aquimarina sp. TaxID=575652 RepID=UPI00261326B0|nr:hypothetical protein [uncultured Aquimarina sp.]
MIVSTFSFLLKFIQRLFLVPFVLVLIVYPSFLKPEPIIHEKYQNVHVVVDYDRHTMLESIYSSNMFFHN